jgi:hypothetical protein
MTIDSNLLSRHEIERLCEGGDVFTASPPEGWDGSVDAGQTRSVLIAGAGQQGDQDVTRG